MILVSSQGRTIHLIFFLSTLTLPHEGKCKCLVLTHLRLPMTKYISVFVVSFVGGAAYCNNDDDNEPDDDEPDDNEPEVDIWNCFWKTFFH